MKPFVSVVVPIFNVEKYLAECLDSLEHQTLKNIEVIMVNDGSTDESRKIAEKYALRNESFILIGRKNGGLSAARNTGMEIAKGEYIYFIDSDDFLSNNALEKLYEKAHRDNLDVLKFVAYTFEDGSKDYVWKKEKGYMYTGEYPDVYHGSDLINKFIFNKDWFASCCMMLTRKIFLDETKLRFYEGIIHEDELFSFELVNLAERIAVLNEPLYYRRIRSGSITQKHDYTNAIRSFCVCAEEADKFIEEHHILNANWRINSFLGIMFWRWNMLSNDKRYSKEIQGYFKRMRPLFKKYVYNPSFPQRVFYTSIPLYGLAHWIMGILRCMEKKFR